MNFRIYEEIKPERPHKDTVRDVIKPAPTFSLLTVCDVIINIFRPAIKVHESNKR